MGKSRVSRIHLSVISCNFNFVQDNGIKFLCLLLKVLKTELLFKCPGI